MMSLFDTVYFFGLLIIEFLFLSSSSQAQRLRGTPDAPVKHVEYGNSIAVTCSPVSTSNAIDLKWYGPYPYDPSSSEPRLIKKRDEMPREDDGGYSRIHSRAVGSDLKLYVNDLKDRDTGVYNCTGRVNNIPSHWSFELQAYVGLTVFAEHDQILVYGETSKIECQVQSQPPPDTSWSLNGLFIDARGSSKYEVASDGLIVYDVQFSDAGLYECVGTEVIEGTTDSVAITVSVESKPVMSKPPTNSTGIAYRDNRIFCEASSTPAPSYKWFLGSKDSSSGTDVTTFDRFQVSGVRGDLTILNTQVDDEQWYWCEASNRAGEVYGKSYFEVQVFPVFSDSVNLNKTETHEGDKVEMFCQSEAKPNPKMYFKRVGNSNPYVNGYQPEDERIRVYEKSSSEQVEGQLIIPQEVVIEITNTSPNDTANYTCISENAAGRNETTMHIIIQHEPAFDLMTPQLQTQCIWEDHERNITALLSGYPQPSVSWARGDGKQISPNQEAFKIFFEPYWKNGRPDEWMANLQIDWQVTKGGIQGAYEPVGNYFPTASNNLGTTDYIIDVRKAEFPGRAISLQVVNRTAQALTLSAEPPIEDNCIPTVAFEIVYGPHLTNEYTTSAIFTLDERHNMKIDGLKSAVSYALLVYSVNDRGRSEVPNSMVVSTLESTPPLPVVLTSGSKSHSSVSHQVVWRTPDDGGEIILEYIISWRKVGQSSWQTRKVDVGTRSWSIPNLEPGTEYELMVQARNKKGLSPEPSPLPTFITDGDPHKEPLSGTLTLELHYIIIICVVALIIVAVATDMTCYCCCDRGIISSICGGSESKHPQPDFLAMDGIGGYNSQHSIQGDQTPASDKSSIPPHEYINTSRLDTTASVTHQQRTAYPVPQPRVPSTYSPAPRPTENVRYHRPPTRQATNYYGDINYHDRLKESPAPAARSIVI